MLKILTEQPDALFDVIAKCAYETLNLSGNANVELMFYSQDEIHELNVRTRNVDKATDVLSYPNLLKILPFNKENYPYDFDETSDSVFLGSIVICEPIATLQAEEFGHSVTRERAYLFLHGLLHLLGYDHVEECDKTLMREKEELILSKMGVNR